MDLNLALLIDSQENEILQVDNAFLCIDETEGGEGMGMETYQ